MLFLALAAVLSVSCGVEGSIKLDYPLNQFDWLIGTWRSETDGIVHWPTIPTMRFGEELQFYPAPVSKVSGVKFLNYSAIATSHNSGDHFHNEQGFMTIEPTGKVLLYANGNNGFAQVERGTIRYGDLRLESEIVGRISIAREIEVEAIKRELRLNGPYLEQILHMRTITHPPEKHSLREHARTLYKKVPEPEPKPVVAEATVDVE